MNSNDNKFLKIYFVTLEMSLLSLIINLMHVYWIHLIVYFMVSSKYYVPKNVITFFVIIFNIENYTNHFMISKSASYNKL